MTEYLCVKPVGGFGPDEELIGCHDVAAFQSKRSATLTWCAAHVEADQGYRHEWIPIDSSEAAIARERYSETVAKVEAERTATAAWCVEHPELVELATAVYTYAQAHYNEGGWDVIVECWELVDIAKSLSEDNPVPSTVEAAIDSFRDAVSVWADRQADAKNSAF